MKIRNGLFAVVFAFSALGGALGGVLVGPASIAQTENDAPAASDVVGPLPEPATNAASSSFAETSGVDLQSGLLDVYADGKKARVLLALPPADEDGLIGRFIYAEYLRSGLGSNTVGLDRAQPGRSYVVVFRRMGGKVYIEAENTGYMASSPDEREQQAVGQSFASSILWAGEIIEEAGDGRALIDISSFLMRDVHGVAARLKRAEQGAFKAEPSLSVVDAGATLVFPKNIEMEALITLVSDEPGPEVRATAPEPRNVTLRLHHSLVALPEPGYEPHMADPRTAAIAHIISDYSADLTSPVEVAYAVRHRLLKLDPNAPRSPVAKPIVYYVDPGVPEPVKSALIEGAGWWAKAFEAAGFMGAYRVEELPEGAHPLDIRYNVINWVHRQTRGWSYGASVIDPRSGEIIKGNVLLGSLRVRQDRMIFEGLLGAEGSGQGGPNDPVEIALARIRQLSAHEVGHTLGFAHNMAASTTGRASVMDYPAPEIQLVPGGGMDFRNAYAVGVGAWDKFTVRWLYGEFPDGTDVPDALDDIVTTAFGAGLRFVADGDSRPAGSAHPYGNLWDTGDEPVSALRHTMRVRRVALNNFGLRNLAAGRPQSNLQDVLVPVYLFHRYQVEAATKPIGGLEFGYGVKGSDAAQARPVDPAWQRDALDAVLETLSPEELDLPDRVLNLLVSGNRAIAAPSRRRELFKSGTGPAFDLLGAADAAAQITLGHLLHPSRLARVIEFHRRSNRYPGLDYVLGRTRAALFDAATGDSARQQPIRQRVQTRYIAILVAHGASPDVSSEVKSAIDIHLRDISERLTRSRVRSSVGPVHADWLRSRIERYLNRDASVEAPQVAPPAVPPGSPIGTTSGCWHC